LTFSTFGPTILGMHPTAIASLPGVLFVDQPFLATKVTVWIDLDPADRKQVESLAYRATALLPIGYDTIEIRFRCDSEKSAD